MRSRAGEIDSGFEITSVAGQGTLVRVEVPIGLRLTAEGEDRIRVLVVDDHEVVRRGLFDFLEGESDLQVVGDAEEGARRSTR